MANSKIPSVQITDTFNTQRGRFNQLVDSVGDVSTLTTTATDITNAIKEHDAELGTISAGAMGTTASTVSTAIAVRSRVTKPALEIIAEPPQPTLIGEMMAVDISLSNPAILVFLFFLCVHHFLLLFRFAVMNVCSSWS